METRTYTDLEKKIGARGTVRVDDTNSEAVRDWVALQGVPGNRVARMKAWTLAKCYNRPKYLAAVLSNQDSTDDDGETAATTGDTSATNSGLEQIKTAMADALTTLADLSDTFATRQDLLDVLADDKLMSALIKKHAPAGLVKTIEIHNTTTGSKVDVGRQHAMFENLLKACTARTPDGHHLNVWLAGPAGSGKTTAAKMVAKAMGLPFFFNGAIDNEYKLLGFTDAKGKIVSRPFREAYTKGGVYLFDEVDASLPAALLAFNAATANGAADFPDGILQRHPDCIIIAAANTWGHGATSGFVGRYKQDDAFLDRFVALEWGVDEELERAVCPNPSWCATVQQARHNAQRQGLKVVISPRASYYGAALIAQGLPLATVIKMTLQKGMSDDQWNAIKP